MLINSGILRIMLVQIHVLGEIRVLPVVFEIGLAHDGPAFHRPVILRRGQSLPASDRGHARAAHKMRRAAGTNGVSVVTRPMSDPACPAAPVAQGQSHGAVGLTGLNPDGSFEAAAIEFDLHHRRQEFGALRILKIDSQGLGCCRTHGHDVLPSQLGDRVGQFLQPTVVVEGPIVQAVIPVKDDLQTLRGGRRATRRGVGGVGPDQGVNGRPSQRSRHSGGRASRQEAIAQELFPAQLEIVPARQTLESLAHNFVRIDRAQATETGQKLQIGQTAKQWGDQRLNRNQRAIGAARVAPRLEVMSGRKMPVANRGRFILVIAQPDHLARAPLRRRPIEFRGRGINRVSSQDCQALDLAGAQSLGQALD